MTKFELRRAAYVAAVALLTGTVVFWIALHCVGSDWFISETHADIIYTGLRRFHEFPFFSFAFNGGTYFLQDPQSNLYSPALPLIWLAGPTIGLRLMEGVWGALGVYAFVVWMRRRVSLEAALIGGVASATGLGVLWRVAVGNDMFLWHLGLPALLWAVDSVIKERSIRSGLVLGLALGLLLLGPTFHSFTYLFLPVVPLFVVMELALARPTWRGLAHISALLMGAVGLASLIASFKFASWLTFPMSRLTLDHGVITLGSALTALFDYSAAQHAVIQATRLTAVGEVVDGWGLEECATALPPVASYLALVGLLSVKRRRAVRPLLFFALVLIAIGLGLACSWPLWNGFLSLTGGNFRVAPRFLGIAAFGVVILATLGADAILTRWSRAGMPIALAVCGLMLGSAVWWTLAATQFAGASNDDTVQLEAMNPIRVAAQERATVDGLNGFTKLVKFDPHRRYIPEGIGCKDGFLVVGNTFRDKLWRSRSHPKVPVPLVIESKRQKAPPPEVTFTHLTVTVRGLAPHTEVRLRALQPVFGFTTRLRPVDANVVVKKPNEKESYISIENRGDRPVEQLRLRVDLPIARGWFFLSLVSGLAAIFGLVWISLPWRRKDAMGVAD